MSGLWQFRRLLRPIGELNRDLKIIFVSNVLTTLGLGLYNSVWPLYIRQLGGNPVDIGTIFSITYLATLLVLIPGGYLADRYDRKIIAIVASFAATPAFFIYAWAHTWTDLIPGVVLFNLTLIALPAFTAYIAGSVTESQAMFSFGVVGAGGSAGIIVSPILGAWLLSVSNFQIIFYLAALLWVLSTVILFPLTPQKPELQHKPESSTSVFRLILQDRRMLYWILLLATVYSTVQMALPFTPNFLTDMRGFNLIANQYAGSTRAFGGTLLGISLGRLGDKWDRRGALAMCLLAFAVGSILLVAGPALSIIVASMLLLGSSNVFRSLGDSIVGRLAPRSSSAQIYSFYQTLAAIGQFITPYIGGYLYTASPRLPFLVVLSLGLLISLVLLLNLQRRAR